LSFYRRAIFFLVLGFFVGVIFIINQFVSIWFIVLVLSWGGIGLFLAWRYETSRLWLLIFSISCIGLALGLWHGAPKINWDDMVCSNLGKNVSGTIVAEPVASEFNQRLTVRPDNQDFNILIFAKRDGVWNYGDRINFRGSLEVPKNFQTDTGQEFAYKNYLRKDDILCLGRGGQTTLLSSGHGSSIKQTLSVIKKEFLNISIIIYLNLNLHCCREFYWAFSRHYRRRCRKIIAGPV